MRKNWIGIIISERWVNERNGKKKHWPNSLINMNLRHDTIWWRGVVAQPFSLAFLAEQEMSEGALGDTKVIIFVVINKLRVVELFFFTENYLLQIKFVASFEKNVSL